MHPSAWIYRPVNVHCRHGRGQGGARATRGAGSVHPRLRGAVEDGSGSAIGRAAGLKKLIAKAKPLLGKGRCAGTGRGGGADAAEELARPASSLAAFRTQLEPA